MNFSFQYEPVMWMAVIVAALDVAIAFGAPIDPDQKTAAIALADALVTLAGGFVARSQVTPAAKAPTTQ